MPRTGWSSTTIGENFEALWLAGDFLDEEAAGEMLVSCTRYTADLPRCDLTPPGLIVAALDSTAGLMPAANDALHSQVARDLAELPANAEHAYSMRIGNVLHQLDWEHVEPPDRERLRILAGRDKPTYHCCCARLVRDQRRRTGPSSAHVPRSYRRTPRRECSPQSQRPQ